MDKKLIIVTDKKGMTYANFLMGLVSQKDDTDDKIIGTEDGTVTVAIYDEKKYEENKHTITSNQRILFLGNGKVAKTEQLNIGVKYNKYGMIYGEIGNRACLYVKNVVPFKEYEKFIKEAQVIQKEVSKVKIKTGDVAQAAAGAAIGAGVELGTAVLGAATILLSGALMPVVAIGGAAVIAGGGIGALKYNTKKNEVKDQQYRYLVMKCYLDYMNNFMK